MSPPGTLTVSRGAEVVYSLGELASCPRQARGELVDQKARALCALYGDAKKSLNFWRRLLWGMIHAERQDRGALSAVTAFLVRVVHDAAEYEGLRSAGALLVSRLRQSGWLDHLEEARAAHKAAVLAC